MSQIAARWLCGSLKMFQKLSRPLSKFLRTAISTPEMEHCSTEIHFHHQNSTFQALKFISSIEIYKVTRHRILNPDLN